MKDLLIGKLLDLANYLMTALLVGYFIDPSNGSSRHVSFSVAMLCVSLIYAASIIFMLAVEFRSLYNRRKRK